MTNESESMPQKQVDLLYHLLRVTHTMDKDTRETIYGLAGHILKKSNYASLAQYLDFYGNTYLLPQMIEFLNSCGFVGTSQIYDLGSGTGWAGAGIARHYGTKAVLVDKRSLVLLRYSEEGYETLLVDLEHQSGVTSLLDSITSAGSADLVVICDTLHCLDNPKKLVEQLKDIAPILILEYVAQANDLWRKSYAQQLHNYGAQSFDSNYILSMVESVYEEPAHGPHTRPQTRVKYELAEPYIMIYAR